MPRFNKGVGWGGGGGGALISGSKHICSLHSSRIERGRGQIVTYPFICVLCILMRTFYEYRLVDGSSVPT